MELGKPDPWCTEQARLVEQAGSTQALCNMGALNIQHMGALSMHTGFSLHVGCSQHPTAWCPNESES
jgi:hypothetical protein